MKRPICLVIGFLLLLSVSSCGSDGSENPVALGYKDALVTESTPEPEPEPEPQEEDGAVTQSQALSIPFPVDYKLSDKLPQEMIEHIKTQREKVFQVTTQSGQELFKSWMHEGLSSDEDVRIAAAVEVLLSRDNENMELPEYLNHDDAANEITLIFDYMKYAYSGYGYFGGDEVFLPIKDDILSELGQSASDGRINTEDYMRMLTSHIYPVVIDAHFGIGMDRTWSGHALQTKAKLSYAVSEEYIFYRVGGEYITMLDGESYTLETIDGGDPDIYVKATLLEDGSFAYVLGEALSLMGEYENKSIGLQLKGKNGDKLVTATLNLCNTPYSKPNNPAYYQYELDDVPVIVNTTLWPDDLPELAEMIDDAGTLWERKSIIIDVISNSGGDDGFVFGWISSFLSKPVALCSNFAVIATKTASVGRNWTISSEPTENDAKEPFQAWYDPAFNLPVNKKNNTVIFLLMSNKNASSGESWPRDLQQIDNVIMAGTNTLGCAQFGNVRQFTLPHSYLSFQCGMSLWMDQDLAQFDCVGYQPDLWIDPAKALERVSRCIALYGLND